VPQAYITGDQAAAACAEAGKRLCADSEWLRACQGSGGWTYPYGPSRVDGLCNDARAVHPAIEFFGTGADWIWSELGNACIDQLPDSLGRTGDLAECVSESGAYDMMGNLHEWTADPNGTFRGGFYVDTVLNGPGCLYATTAHNRGHWDYSTGFRCCGG
jgi:formylglycine-generating enzyme required for sulfatase activity